VCSDKSEGAFLAYLGTREEREIQGRSAKDAIELRKKDSKATLQ
jgi:hypothetical protein